MKSLNTDVVIVGAGLAGIYTALNLPSELNVTLLSYYDDNSSLAQGGVAACIKETDSFSSHIADTLRAGHYKNELNAVSQLVKEGPKQIEALIKLGVDFDQDASGNIASTLEGGHSHHRILHIDGDSTGKGIMDRLSDVIPTKSNIKRIHSARLLSLMSDKDQVYGIQYLKDGRIQQLNARFTILATGGIGDLYSQTTNHQGAIGTGIALAHQAGAKCQDMHYIQFHPTAFYEPSKGHRFLISEALRGEGARLLDGNRHRFMEDFDPRLELAPRDVVAKAIQDVIRQQDKPFVYLDTRHMDSTLLAQRFPNISKHLLSRGYQLGKDLIPVTPVAHYTIGGIAVNRHGQSSLNGLYACGETTSSGVHGANRLASNSLLECLVYGAAIATHIKTQLCNDTDRKILNPPITPWASNFKNTIPNDHVINTIKDSMTSHVGIERSTTAMNTLLDDLRLKLHHYEATRYQTYEDFYIHTMIYTSILVLKDALAHPSLGCHHLLTSDLHNEPTKKARQNHDRHYQCS